MHHPTHRITHTTAFITPVMDHWLEGEIAQWVLYLTMHSTHFKNLSLYGIQHMVKEYS